MDREMQSNLNKTSLTKYSKTSEGRNTYSRCNISRAVSAVFIEEICVTVKGNCL